MAKKKSKTRAKKLKEAVQRKVRQAVGRITLAIGPKHTEKVHQPNGYVSKSVRYNTASGENIEKFGKRFFNVIMNERIPRTFKYEIDRTTSWCESPNAIQIRGPTGMIAHAKLGFTKDSIIIEALQGEKGKKEELIEFTKKTGKQAFNYLLERIEHTARCAEKKYVKIRVPESLYWYWNSKKYARVEGIGRKEIKELRKRMETLYSSISKNSGYKRTARFFVKEL